MKKSAGTLSRWSLGSSDPGKWLLAIACVAGLLLAGCGDEKTPSQPAQPSPAAGTFSITGRVFANDQSTSAGVAGARVDIINGPNQGKQTDTDAAGMYRLDQLAGGFVTLRVTAPGYLGTLESLTLTASVSVNLGITIATLTTLGQVVDAETNASLGRVEIGGSAVAPSWSDAAGHFIVAAQSASASPLSVSFTGPANLQRITNLIVPGDFTTVSLISNSFNLAAFEELCRGSGGLRRLRDAPALIVQLTDLQFTTSGALTAEALETGMSDTDAQDMVNDMVFALQALTGDNFHAFSSVTFDRAPAGTVVNLLTPGSVTVVRLAGLRSPTAVGYGRWQQLPSGEVTGGLAMLDATYDRDPFARRRVRHHELGHAIGYLHVTTAFSVMNTSTGPDIPTPLDRAMTRVAFRRPPGNRAPDTDPAGTTGTSAGGGGSAFWSAPIR